MEWKIMFYFVVYIISTSTILGTFTTVSDPCAGYHSNNNDKNIVTMCNDDYAREDNPDINIPVDSVVLRVSKHQENCKCHASFINQTKQLSIYARPYGGYANAVPDEPKCGLAIDIQSNTTVTKESPIQCSENFNRQLAFLQNGEVLQLTSKFIDGNFTRGYCLQFYRVYDVQRNFHLQIECYKKDMSTDAILDINLQSTTPTPAVDNKASSVTPGLRNDSDITSQPRVDEVNDSDGKSSVIIIAGSSAGGVLVLLLVIIVAMCKCRKSTRKDGRAECPPVNDSVNQSDVEYDSYGLKDNILYVSADEQFDTDNANDPPNKRKTSSTYEGNYSTIDIDVPRNPDTGDYSTVDLEENDEKQYYNVTLQKPKPMLKPKPASQKEQPTTTAKNSEMDKSTSNLEYAVVNKRNIKAEYAVVDKTKRIDDGVKHFSVQGTGDEYAMVKKQ